MVDPESDTEVPRPQDTVADEAGAALLPSAEVVEVAATRQDPS